MTTNTSLFAQILPMFTDQIERAATEALRHILEQSESARGALEHMLLTAGAEVGSLSRFRTEVTGEEGERVDLVCYDIKGVERVIIEAKFGAGLTDNQPNTYIERLPEKGHSVLLLIAPAQYTETLWPELWRRAATDYTLTLISESGDLRSAVIDGSECKMMATNWRAVLERMESRASKAGELATVCDIRQLIGLTERKSSERGLCLCGCGEAIRPTSRYYDDHYKRVRDTLGRVQKMWVRTQWGIQDAKITDEDLSLFTYIVARAEVDPGLSAAGHSASAIRRFAAELGLRDRRASAD